MLYHIIYKIMQSYGKLREIQNKITTIISSATHGATPKGFSIFSLPFPRFCVVFGYCLLIKNAPWLNYIIFSHVNIWVY